MVTARGARILVAHLETCRPYTVAYPGMAGLAGAALAGGASPAAWSAAWLAPTLIWVGGLYFGDYADRALDALGKPHRPIPSGRLAPRTALTVGFGCVTVALIVTACVDLRAIAIVLLGAAGVVGYSTVGKRRGLLGNLLRGALTGLVLIFVATLARGGPTPEVLGWALVFCLQDTGSNLVGTLRDVSGDRAGGYRTAPVVFGSACAGRRAAACFGAAIPGAFALYGRSADLGLVLLIAAAALGWAGYATVLRDPADPRKALRAHEILVAERLVLAGAVVSRGLGSAWALVLLAAALAVSLTTQSLLRTRHEFGDTEVGSA